VCKIILDRNCACYMTVFLLMRGCSMLHCIQIYVDLVCSDRRKRGVYSRVAPPMSSLLVLSCVSPTLRPWLVLGNRAFKKPRPNK